MQVTYVGLHFCELTKENKRFLIRHDIVGLEKERDLKLVYVGCGFWL
jgi:hypothetical protein